MKYKASKQIIGLVIENQDNPGIKIADLCPIFQLITKKLEVIIDIFNQWVKDKDEDAFQLYAGSFIAALSLLVDHQKSYEDFRRRFFEIYPISDDMYKSDKLSKKFVDLFHHLRRFFGMEEAYYKQRILPLSNQDSGFLQKYMSIVKNVLSVHIRRIIAELNEEKSHPYLRDPLYIKAMKDLRTGFYFAMEYSNKNTRESRPSIVSQQSWNTNQIR